MLDATGYETSGAPGEERNVLDLVWETVQDLSVHYHILCGPIHNHDHLEVVSGETNDDKMFVVMCHSDVEDGATVRYNQSSQLDTRIDFPDN